MALPYPREPSGLELWMRSDWKDGIFREESIRQDRIAERQIPSYLWERWKADLADGEYNWQRFQSEVSSASRVMQAWGTDDAEWGEVLDAVERALDVEVDVERDS